MALVAGGSSSPRCVWAYWRLNGVDAYGLSKMGESQTIDLHEPGIYNVVVDVSDRASGAFGRAQTMVYWPITKASILDNR